MTRQVEADMIVEDDASHVANIGRLVEDMELKMRNLLREPTVLFLCFVPCKALTRAEEVYFGKAKDVVGDLRSEQLPSNASESASQLTHAGLPSLTEASKDKASHRDMIRSMNR